MTIRRVSLGALMVILAGFVTLMQSHPVYAQEKTVIVDFAKDPLNRRPESFLNFWSVGGEAGKWVVLEDETFPETKRVVAQTSSWDKGTNHYAILVYKYGNIRNMDTSVHIKISGASEEASAGLAFRFQDGNNYFVFEASSGNGTLSFYKMTDGDRETIARVLTSVSPEEWHKLRVRCSEFDCECYFDDKLIFKPRLSQFWRGNVAFWTRADTQARFAGLSITTQEEANVLDQIKKRFFAGNQQEQK